MSFYSRQYPSLALASAVVIGAVYALSNIFRLGWQWQIILIDFSFGFALSMLVWWYNLVVYPPLERRFLPGQRKRWRWGGAGCFDSCTHYADG